MLTFVWYSANIEDLLKQDNIKFVGWEKNTKGMFCPKYVDLSETMDSKKWVYQFKNTIWHNYLSCYLWIFNNRYFFLDKQKDL